MSTGERGYKHYPAAEEENPGNPENLIEQLVDPHKRDDRAGGYPTLPATLDVSGYPVTSGGEPPETTPEFHPHDKRRRNKFIGAGVVLATLAAGAGIGFGVNRSNNSEAPRPQPTASAGVAPGEIITPLPSEMPPESPLALEYSPNDPNKWTNETVPLFLNGKEGVKEYTGVESFKKAIAVTVAEHPKPEQAMEGFVNRFNEWLNYGTNAEARDRYMTYANADLSDYTTPAIGTDVVDPAFKEALFDSDNVVSDDLAMRRDNTCRLWSQRDENYRVEYTLEKQMRWATTENGESYMRTFLLLKLQDQEHPTPTTIDRILLGSTIYPDEDGNWKIKLAGIEDANKR